MISIIVAMSPNHAIGYKGSLPWHIPEDLAHFKELTMGNTIVMGRKTYDSLPHGALPGRRNIVISRSTTQIPGCDVFSSFEQLLPLFSMPLLSNGEPNRGNQSKSNGEPNRGTTSNGDELFIIGGASLYAAALPFADKLYITLVDKNPPHADTFFPSFDISEWTEIKKEKHDGFSFVEMIKTKAS